MMLARFNSASRYSWLLTPALLAACLPAVLPAQTATGRAKVAPFTTVFVTTGTLLMDVTKLNPRFERLDLDAADRPGFNTISNDGYAIGLGAYGPVLNRMILGGEVVTADLGEEAHPSGKTNHLTTTYVLGSVGYAAWTSWRVNVVPFFGLGLGTARLVLKNRNGGPTVPDAFDPTFDEIIASPGSRSTMTGTYVLVQPGLAVDFLILGNANSARGLTLGLRVASAISPNRTPWKYEGREVFGGPDLGPTSGVFRLTLGMGGFRLGGSAPAR